MSRLRFSGLAGQIWGPLFGPNNGHKSWPHFSGSSYIFIGIAKKRSKKLNQIAASFLGPRNHVPDRRLHGGTACKAKPAARNCDDTNHLNPHVQNKSGGLAAASRKPDANKNRCHVCGFLASRDRSGAHFLDQIMATKVGPIFLDPLIFS